MKQRAFSSYLLLTTAVTTLGMANIACNSSGSRPRIDPAGDSDTGSNQGDTRITACDGFALEVGETCDGAFLNNETCEALGWDGGTLACNATCTGWDTEGCYNVSTDCNNDVLDSGETCDTSKLDNKDCGTEGFAGGTLACNDSCTGYDTSGCFCTGPDTYRGGGMNTQLADGEPCNYESDCANGCNADYFCGPEGVTPVDHSVDLLADGAACADSATCASGYCWESGSTWICAQSCDTPTTNPLSGALNCQAIEEGSSAPQSGSACIPGPGTGTIGDACEIGEFDCESGICLNEDFCTESCDPADETSCPESTTCEFLVASYFGDIFICVDDSRIGAGVSGDACSGPFDCTDGMVCFDSQCTATCPNGNECDADATTYCAADHPAGPMCLADDTRVVVGDPCEFTSQCPDNAICRDGGAGAVCTETCMQTVDCNAMGDTCTFVDTGAALDTVINLYDAVDSAEPMATNDDRSGSYFSEIQTDLTAGTHVLWLEVSRYAGSAEGAYRLDMYADAGAGAPTLLPIIEIEPNDTRATADDLTPSGPASLLGFTVLASFADTADDAPDVDVFRFEFTLASAATIVLRTDYVQSGVCTDASTLVRDGGDCTTSAQCQNECFPFARGGAQAFCATPCESNGDCGNSESCAIFQDTTPTTGFCFDAGTISLGNAAFGEICDGPQECTSSMCARHPYDNSFRCAAPCGNAAAGDACASDAGVCSHSNPIYGQACIAHLNGSGLEGDTCRYDEDCGSLLRCASDRCTSEGVSRYNPPLAQPVGNPCNVDQDCATDRCNDLYVCEAPEAPIEACDAANGVVDAGELCDPNATVIYTTCADLGAGETETPGCMLNCAGWDLSVCGSGLANDQPCNADGECNSGYCFPGDSAWFCASSCTAADDTSCTEKVMGLDSSCIEGEPGIFACLPQGGAGIVSEPCTSGYLDCESGLCWDSAFCIDTCSLEKSDCGREAACVAFEFPVDRQTDTQLTILDDAAYAVVGPDDDSGPGLWSLAEYTYQGSMPAAFLVLVEPSAVNPMPGEYQLQLFTDTAPPPFGVASLESELRSTPVSNDSAITAQTIDEAIPRRIQAAMADSTDQDYYRVTLFPGETLTAATATPLAHVCWPLDQLGRDANVECNLGFECASEVCLEDGLCGDECTGTGACALGDVCARPTDGVRDFCLAPLAFEASCEGAPTEPTLSEPWFVPQCPNGLCLPGTDGPVCSDLCVSNAEGTGCGPRDSTTANGLFTGECLYWDNLADAGIAEYVCLPHLGQSMTTGEGCWLDADCASFCCNKSSGGIEGVCVAGGTGCQRN